MSIRGERRPALVVAMLAVVNFADAAAQDISVVGEVGAANEYMYRGSTQSLGPYIWATADLVSDTGFYAGAWVANVDFEGEDTFAEYDLYAGYRRRVSAFTYDVSVVRVDYPGSPESYEFYSLRSAVRWDAPAGWMRAVASGSPDGPAYYGAMFALELSGGLNLDAASSVNGGAGAQTVGDLDNDYVWWHAGYTRRLAPNLVIDLRWWDNDSRGYGQSYQPRLVLGVTREFSANF